MYLIFDAEVWRGLGGKQERNRGSVGHFDRQSKRRQPPSVWQAHVGPGVDEETGCRMLIVGNG